MIPTREIEQDLNLPEPGVHTMSHRAALLSVCCLVLGLHATVVKSTIAAPARRPNVLWICADDHAAYVTGTYGNRLVKTPNLDQLATQGIRFDRAFCNSPVCTASRQSFLTGRYPRTIGVTQLSTPLPESETTLAEVFAAAGYKTAAIGKMHFNSSLTHGFETRLDQPEFQKWLALKGKTPISPQVEVQPPWRPFRDPANIWLNSANRPFGATQEDMPSSWLANQAQQWLNKRMEESRGSANGGDPFFLIVSFYEPHSPFHFPIEYRGRHAADEFEAPQVGPEDDWQIPEIFRNLSVQEKQGIAAAYHTSVEFLDQNVGRVLQVLNSTGFDSETIVIYTGDHGYMLGQHGRFEKHCCYDPAIRSPLMMRYPSRIPPGTNTTALVEFIDIAPTLLEICQVAIPQAIQGCSFSHLFQKPTEKHRDEVFIEYAENEEGAIRTDRWKLVYTTGQRQREDGYTTGRPLPGRNVRLFDLARDPEEFTNLAEQPDYVTLVAELTQKLADHFRRTAREPELLPVGGDPRVLLDEALKPRDVKPTP